MPRIFAHHTVPEMLVVHPALPTATVKDFPALAKAKHGELMFGSAGAGTYVKGADMFLEDRTLFSTAYPTKDIQESVRDFLGLGWREEIIPKILWRNAAKLLKIVA